MKKEKHVLYFIAMNLLFIIISLFIFPGPYYVALGNVCAIIGSIWTYILMKN